MRPTGGYQDLLLAKRWMLPYFHFDDDMILCDSREQATRWLLSAAMWMRQGEGSNSYLISLEGAPLALLHLEPVGLGQWQTRMHLQVAPDSDAKSVLRGITKLVPLIEKALSLRGTRIIFFTSRSDAMCRFMERMDYRGMGSVESDGTVMAKGINGFVLGPETKPCAVARS